MLGRYSTYVCISWQRCVLISRRLVILQTGVGLMKHVPETQLEGARVDTIFSMTWPEVTLTVQNIERFSNLTFQFEYRKASDKRFFCMKGEM